MSESGKPTPCTHQGIQLLIWLEAALKEQGALPRDIVERYPELPRDDRQRVPVDPGDDGPAEIRNADPLTIALHRHRNEDTLAPSEY